MSTVDTFIKGLKPRSKNLANQYRYNFMFKGDGLKWLEAFLQKQSPAVALEICLNNVRGIQAMAHSWGGTAFKAHLINYFDSPEGDLRYLEQIELIHGRELSIGYYRDKHTAKYGSGDFLRYILAQNGYVPCDPEDYSAQALWPYLAHNLDVMDEALGIKPHTKVKLGRTDAIQLLAALPKPPLRYFGPLLEAATGQKKAGRQEARDMLRGVKEVDARLITLLQDTRQAIRAGAANWMGERQNKEFAKPIKERLKKEKSELAKASI